MISLFSRAWLSTLENGKRQSSVKNGSIDFEACLKEVDRLKYDLSTHQARVSYLESKTESLQIEISLSEMQARAHNSKLTILGLRYLTKHREYLALEASGLFNGDWYLDAYPNVAFTKEGALFHFITKGWQEGKKPNPIFDTSWYLNTYPDVARAKINPVLHYFLYGEGGEERRNPSPDFDANLFLQEHPALRIYKLNGLAYYLRWFMVTPEERYSRNLPHDSLRNSLPEKGLNELPSGFNAEWYADMNDLVHGSIEECRADFLNHRSGSKRKRVAFFGYAWTASWQLDPYMREIVSTIASLGFDVDVYIGNQFTQDAATKGFRVDLDRCDLCHFIRGKSYDCAIAFNNSLVMREVVEALDCKIVSIVVDSIHHLFDYSREKNEAFMLPIFIAPIYTSLVDELRALKGRIAEVDFLPAATQIPRARSNISKDQDTIAISWIASLLGDCHTDLFIKKVLSTEGAQVDLSLCIEDIKSNGCFSNEPQIEIAVSRLCGMAAWERQYLEMQLQNLVSSRIRWEIVEKLAGNGLKVFGNRRWETLAPFSPNVAQALRPGWNIRRHSDLQEIYNRSKISINIPQAQAASGMQYRILDILASDSLLITKKIPGSDIERVFGSNAPIVTYFDLNDLEAKCDYFLKNETERRALVVECNKLVADGFSFRERVLQYLNLSNPSLGLHPNITLSDSKGRINLIDLSWIQDWSH